MFVQLTTYTIDYLHMHPILFILQVFLSIFNCIEYKIDYVYCAENKQIFSLLKFPFGIMSHEPAG